MRVLMNVLLICQNICFGSVIWFLIQENPKATFSFCFNSFRCGNVNWAKRLKCNICNTNKPGQNEGGVRYDSMPMIRLPLY